MPTIPLYNCDGKKVENLELPDKLFGGRVKKDVIQQAVLKYRAGARQGTANTKERADVSGGGKKPYRQKGTGQARAGSNRSPLWKGGGVTFGPHPRNFNYSVPQKIRTAALRESINAKFLANDLHCVDQFSNTIQKTKEFAKILETLQIKGKVLAVVDKNNEHIQRASRNLPHFALARAADVNAYDVMRHRKILVTKTAFKQLLSRIG